MNLPLTFEFHISKAARERYQFDESLFGLSGNVVFANFHAARVFAQRMNAQRDLVRFPEQAVKSGQITAMGLIDGASVSPASQSPGPRQSPGLAGRQNRCR